MRFARSPIGSAGNARTRAPMRIDVAMHRRPQTRRAVVAGALAAASAALVGRPAIAQGTSGRVLVVGGGFAGAACARELRRLEPKLGVSLIETSPTFVACPFS